MSVQTAVVMLPSTVVQIELPGADVTVLPGVSWGSVEAFPTPAYWTYQVLARRVVGGPTRHRLGACLAEEVAACLLGGHGIPASIGLAAFHRLRDLRAFAQPLPESELLTMLQHPLEVNGRSVRYRFARQKASYLSAALSRLASTTPPTQTGRALRDWLLDLPGIGLKTASWIARNWLDADDVAILDIHILRAGALGGFLDAELKVERDYLEIEAQFLKFAKAIGVRASELDAVIWHEMMSSPQTVTQLMGGRRTASTSPAASPSLRRRSHKRSPDPHQPRLID